MVNSLLKTSKCSPSQCELATGLIYNYLLLFKKNNNEQGVFYTELLDEDLDDNNELGLSDADLFVAKFLLKVTEKLFEHLD